MTRIVHFETVSYLYNVPTKDIRYHVSYHVCKKHHTNIFMDIIELVFGIIFWVHHFLLPNNYRLIYMSFSKEKILPLSSWFYILMCWEGSAFSTVHVHFVTDWLFLIASCLYDKLIDCSDKVHLQLFHAYSRRETISINQLVKFCKLKNSHLSVAKIVWDSQCTGICFCKGSLSCSVRDTAQHH